MNPNVAEGLQYRPAGDISIKGSTALGNEIIKEDKLVNVQFQEASISGTVSGQTVNSQCAVLLRLFQAQNCPQTKLGG